jgi:hypothetical protein
MENPDEIRETITEEREIIMLKVPVDKESLNTIKIYAEMLRIDQGSLTNQIIRSGLKTIKVKLNELPYTDLQKLIKNHQEGKQIS